MTTMLDALISKKVLGGGEFIISSSHYEDTFIPEEKTEDQIMIAETVRNLVETQVLPNSTRLDKQEEGLALNILRQAAELGLLGADMPEEYGGMALDTNTNNIITDELGPSGGWTVTFAVQTGIGMLPILYFGNEAQKAKYLPPLISAEIIGAYCLTEPGSGSDALAAKTRADLSADGKHYILNGQKMWISNGGWADLYIVFAKIDGEKFTAFIVERDSEGLTLGAEEEKLGIKGSSTRQVFFENVKVPVENVLGEIGKGHLIAFHVLNIGRYKLGAMCLGGSKRSVTTAVNYANERKQFGQPIANFGAIKHKLAEQVIRIFAGDSAQYRTSQMLQSYNEVLKAKGLGFGEAKQKAAEEYSIECAIMKIVGSEVLDFVVDETLQIYGGMGYSEEGTVARAYRDSRINRIYEGTNEINRLLMVDQLLKRAMKGQLDIVSPAWEVQKELASMPNFDAHEGVYGMEEAAVKDFKKIILMVAGAAAKMQMDGQINLKEEQEVLTNVANIMIDTFMAESLLLRVQKLANMEEVPLAQEVYDAILKTFITDATARINKQATDALVSFAEGDLLKTFLMGLKRFTKYPPVNVKKMRRLIADTLIEANRYCFS
jgi:alkylation response protein AidB-like acyl-CoA dehydrogenase